MAGLSGPDNGSTGGGGSVSGASGKSGPGSSGTGSAGSIGGEVSGAGAGWVMFTAAYMNLMAARQNDGCGSAQTTRAHQAGQLPKSPVGQRVGRYGGGP